MNRIRCWLRNFHRWQVPWLALLIRGDYRFPGVCADCGARTTRTANQWQEAGGE